MVNDQFLEDIESKLTKKEFNKFKKKNQEGGEEQGQQQEEQEQQEEHEEYKKDNKKDNRFKKIIKKQKNEFRKSVDRMDTLYKIFKKYLLQPLIMIIVTIIIYYSVKYIIKLYYRYPRSFALAKYLDISGKYDKSTGLDMELANILSNSLTDYLITPSIILSKINLNSHSFIRTSNTDTEDKTKMKDNYTNYLIEHLFGNYMNNNKFYELLRQFVEHSSDIYNSGYIVKNNNNYKNNDIYDNKYFGKYINDIEDKLEINKYLIQFFKNNVTINPSYNKKLDQKLDNNIVNDFIDNLKAKTVEKYTIQINKSRDRIYNFFYEILTTTSSKLDTNRNVLEYYKNLFLRNVLYMIILKNDETISNQLGNLENKNILSYINPEVFVENNSILQKYGDQLYMKNDNGDIVLFKDNMFINDIQLKINDKKNNDKEIIDFIVRFKDLFTKNFEEIKYALLDKKLEKYKSTDHRVLYNEYKQKLLENKNKNYDSENNLINEIYNFNTISKNKNKHKIPKKFDISKLDNSEIKIINIYNHLIILETFINNYDDFINTENINDNYDNCVKYLYYIEQFTVANVYNSDKDISEKILTNEQIESLISNKEDIESSFFKLLDYLLYQKDKDLINCSMFASLLLYNSSNTNITKNDLHDLSKFYFSFVEIKLGSNYINDIKEYKENRTDWNIKQNFFYNKIDNILKNVIWKQYIKKELFYKYDANNSYIYWKFIRDLLSDRCTFFTTKTEKEAMNCNNDRFVEGFGFLKKLLSIPKLLGNLPKFLGMFLNFGEGIIRGIKFIGDFKPPIIGFIIFVIKVFIYLFILIFLMILALPMFAGGVISAAYLIKNGSITYGLLLLTLIICALLFQQWVHDKTNNKVNIIFYTDENGEVASISIAHFIVAIIYGIIQTIILIAKIILMLVIVVVLFILYIIVLIFDEILGDLRFTKFLYKNLFSCENEPLAWYKNSRYDLGNKAKKGFFCSLNCGTNYRLSENSLFCERAPNNVPYYCPQPLLYNIYKNEKISGSNKIISFLINNHPRLVYFSPQKQFEFILNYKKDKKNYYETCNNFFSNEKNIVGKTVCATGYDSNNNKITNKIKDICKQTYCSNGKYENFCYKYQDNDNLLDDYKFKDENKVIQFIKNSFIIAIIMYISLYTINELDKNNILSDKILDNSSFKINEFIRKGFSFLRPIPRSI